MDTGELILELFIADLFHLCYGVEGLTYERCE